MKILILVMSSSVDHYPELEKIQMETWDSIYENNIKTIYYLAGQKTELIENKLYIEGGEPWPNFFKRMLLAFKKCLDFEFDYIFRTDNSAYVNKKELKKILLDKPRINFYGGQLFYKNLDTSVNFMWGEGFCLSRDLVEYIVSMTPDISHKEVLDDVEISNILYGKTPFVNLPIYNYYEDEKPIPIVHIYRCKSPDKQGQEALMEIHNILTSK